MNFSRLKNGTIVWGGLHHHLKGVSRMLVTSSTLGVKDNVIQKVALDPKDVGKSAIRTVHLDL